MLNGVSHLQTRQVLVTGGAGFVGSHVALQLLLAGFTVYVVDNLHASGEEVIRRLKDLAGSYKSNISFFTVDLRDRDALERLFLSTRFDAVIHLGTYFSPTESTVNALQCHSNNLVSANNLLELMSTYGCKKLIFSSSASVYGEPKVSPCSEEHPLNPITPFGRSNLCIENILDDVYNSDEDWRIVVLRCFNPAGAHPSGILGEDLESIPKDLMGALQQVAVGKRLALTIYGSDYSTRDGTGARDYVHVMDLASGHVAALLKLFSTSYRGCNAYNLGTGHSATVLEIVAAFRKASEKDICLRFSTRRIGDSSLLVASVKKAEKELGWKASFQIEDICQDHWNWICKNPWGYTDTNYILPEK